MSTESKDLKPDNDNLRKQIEDYNTKLNSVLTELDKLREEPKELQKNYQPKIEELEAKNAELNDRVQKTTLENELLRKHLDDIVQERKRRSTERRRRKEEQMKKIVDQATRKLENDKRKLDEKKHMIEATDLVKNAVQTQDDLRKFGEIPSGKTPETPEYVFDEEVPNYAVGEIPVDKDILDQAVVEHAGREPEPPSGTREAQRSKPGNNFFEVMEPTVARAPFETMATEPEGLVPPMIQKAPIPQKFLPDPLMELANFDNDPSCPYSSSREVYPGFNVFPKAPKEQVWTAVNVDPNNRISVMQNARNFMENARKHPGFKEMMDKQFLDMDINSLPEDEFYDFSVKLLFLMNKFNDPNFVPEPIVKPITEMEIMQLLDKELKSKFSIEPLPNDLLKFKLNKDEECQVHKEKYPDVLKEILPILVPIVHNRNNLSPEQAVKEGVEKNLPAIHEIINKMKEPELLKTDEDKEDSSESGDSMTPSSAKGIFAAGLMAKIKNILASKQKEKVKEYRIVDPKTGRVSWTRTHFIFVIDSSGIF